MKIRLTLKEEESGKRTKILIKISVFEVRHIFIKQSNIIIKNFTIKCYKLKYSYFRDLKLLKRTIEQKQQHEKKNELIFLSLTD